jgi:histidine triad (HIT) family protein
MSCVFCSILEGTSPASRVYEDEFTLAFMDIRPVRSGQVLVIPKVHVDHFCDLPDDPAIWIHRLGLRLSRVVRRVLTPKRVGTIIHGFGVPHAHLIVLPLEHPWDITAAQFSYVDNGEVKFRWENVPVAAREDLDRIAEALRGGLT